MRIELTPQQKDAQALFRAFVDQEIVPNAHQYDQEECIPQALIQKLAKAGYLGSILPEKHGGQGLDMITYGLLTEEIGRGCSSVRSLLTVHDMICHALFRWGSQSQKDRHLKE